MMKHALRIGVLLASLLPALSAAAGAPDERTTIAVSYFDNNTGDAAYDPLQKGLADMLITDLAGVRTLRVVERARLQTVLDELALSGSSFIDPKTAQKLGKGLAARFILTGGYLMQVDQLRIDARLVAVESGEVVATQQVAGKKEHFFAMEKELVDKLIEELGLELSFEEKATLRKNPTESYDAFFAYSQGLHALDAGERDEARKRFMAALAADPRYAAAKDAVARLRVIIDKHESKQAAFADDLIRGLDPSAKDFGQRVHAVLGNLANDTAIGIQKKLAVLQWIVENDLNPSMSGFSPAATEILGFASRYLSDPDTNVFIPGTCELMITRMGGAMAVGQCKAYLNVLDAYADQDPEEMRKSWAKTMREARLDWEKALYANYAAAQRLLRTCAQKAAELAPAPTKAP